MYIYILYYNNCIYIYYIYIYIYIYYTYIILTDGQWGGGGGGGLFFEFFPNFRMVGTPKGQFSPISRIFEIFHFLAIFGAVENRKNDLFLIIFAIFGFFTFFKRL